LAAKLLVAWVLEEPVIYERLASFKYLESVSGLWELPSAPTERRAGELIDRLRLGSYAHEP
jgi:ABC-2 type transport system ATP-binding protein